jgi:hypothetical protein
MHGPTILERSLTRRTVTDKAGRRWQYNSRSDRHSKVACWTVLFDLLLASEPLQRDVREGRVYFGINHTMVNYQTGRQKDLDLVLCTHGGDIGGKSSSFADLADKYELELDKPERALLAALPTLRTSLVGSVRVALEAKATMTAHIAALPRLYDELESSHVVIHGNADEAIAVAYAIVNLSDTFVSSVTNSSDKKSDAIKYTQHKQPRDAERTLEKLREIPRRAAPGKPGFDAIGATVISFVNDGSPVRIVRDPPAPQHNDVLSYEGMIRRVAHAYETKYR